MTAVMLEGQDSELVRQGAIENGKRKPRHEVTTHVCLDNTPPFGSLLDDTNSTVHGVEKLRAKTGNSPFVELSRLDQFHLGIRMVNQEHPRARRAACTTSSCVRPTAAPEESSWSRRMASRTASCSSASVRPVSMLSQSV